MICAHVVFSPRNFPSSNTLPSVELRLFVRHLWRISDRSIHCIRDIRKVGVGTNAGARTGTPWWSILWLSVTTWNAFATSEMSRPRFPTVGTLVTVLRALLGAHFQIKELHGAVVFTKNYALQSDYSTVRYSLQYSTFVESRDSSILLTLQYELGKSI